MTDTPAPDQVHGRAGGDEGVKTTQTGEEQRPMGGTGTHNSVGAVPDWEGWGLSLQSGEATSELRPEVEESACPGARGEVESLLTEPPALSPVSQWDNRSCGHPGIRVK